MKKDLSFTCGLNFLVLFFLNHLCYPAKAQCEGKAGENRVICSDVNQDSVFLGDTSMPFWGAPPYTYTWSCTDRFLSKEYTASDFLDDTIVARPRLKANLSSKGVWFKLQVSDSLGDSCVDSVYLKGSSYYWIPEMSRTQIYKGDSARLDALFTGGIPPLSYTWSPKTGLTDPHDLNTWAKPDTSTLYIVEVKDSAGCTTHFGFDLWVWAVGLKEGKKDPLFILFPNPMTESTSLLYDGYPCKTCTLILYDGLGRFVRETTLSEENTLFYREELKSGIYRYRLFKSGEYIGQGSLQLY